MIEHSQAAIAAHPALDRDSKVAYCLRNDGNKVRQRFLTGKSYAMACLFTFHMRNCYDAWSFMGLKV